MLVLYNNCSKISKDIKLFDVSAEALEANQTTPMNDVPTLREQSTTDTCSQSTATSNAAPPIEDAVPGVQQSNGLSDTDLSLLQSAAVPLKKIQSSEAGSHTQESSNSSPS